MGAGNLPAISIITPVYNTGEYLARCLTSIINQSFADFEVVMVDDGSTDNSAGIIRDFLARDDRIRYFYQENQGPGVARNLAVSKARGDYIAFVDSDDTIDPELLEKIMSRVKQDTPDLLFFEYKTHSGDGARVLKISDQSEFARLQKAELVACQITARLPYGVWNRVVRRSLVVENGMEFLPIRNEEESVFSVAQLLYSQKTVFMADGYYNYYQREGSAHRQHRNFFDLTIVRAISGLLDNNEVAGQYARVINSAVVYKCVTSIYNCAGRYRMGEAVSETKSYIRRIGAEYDLKNIDKAYLDRRVRFMLPLFRLKFYRLIFLAGKIYNAYKKISGRV